MFEYIAKYIFGSEDSTDTDTCYVVKEIPENVKELVDSLTNENANVLTIENGCVKECYKGTVDEMNNCLIDTYELHTQSYPLLITKRLPRDKVVKDIRAIRGILSYLSRTAHRDIIKKALRSGFKTRIETVGQIDLNIVDFSKLNKKFNGVSALKVIAFQIGQALGLHLGLELYTKKQISEAFYKLKPYLYRETLDTDDLQKMINVYLNYLNSYYEITDYSDRTSLINGVLYDMKTELIKK